MDLNFNILILANDARSYYDAYNLLNEESSKLHRIQANKTQEHLNKFKGLSVPMRVVEHNVDLTTPALLCLAFSVELHVKLLLKTHDINAKGHDIGKLLKKLPEDDIIFISMHEDFHPTQQREHFFRNIAIASNLFIRTRYYFEDVSTFHFNSGFCATLTKVLRKRIVERVPYLSYDLGSFSD